MHRVPDVPILIFEKGQPPVVQVVKIIHFERLIDVYLPNCMFRFLVFDNEVILRRTSSKPPISRIIAPIFVSWSTVFFKADSTSSAGLS